MGNSEMPLVSVAAIFYNQRDCACETVRSLFAQTYGNCEIILSDDCSADGTGAILEKLAADYNGPHKIVVNINEKNLGIGNHCKRVFSMCHGEWIVTCGGDDSFAPDRVKHVVEYAGEYPNVVAIGCSSLEIDGGGDCVLEKPLVDRPTVYPKYVDGDFSYELSPRRMAPMCFIAGALAAWHRKVVDLAPFPADVVAEDVVLSLRASLLGDTLFIPELDVRRRVGGVSLKRRRSLARAERREHRRRCAVMCFRSEYAVLKECEGYPFPVSGEFKEKLWSDSAVALLKCMDLPFSEMRLYTAALRRTMKVQGLLRSLEMAFSAGRLCKFCGMLIITLFHGLSKEVHE
jgi:glycosyltransferase involved in cell wall biosynthesis